MRVSAFDEKLIKEKIKSAFLEVTDSERTAYDIAFHMTDWLSDIKNLEDFYSNIEHLNNDEITSFIYRFLAHVPNHLNAAMKLSGMGKVTDVFGADIFEDDE